MIKTLFERQFYEHIHHEYKSGEHFDSLSSRQPRSDLLWSLCGEPLLTASIVISSFSPSICLQEEAVCSSTPCNSPTKTPPPISRATPHLRATSSRIQHGNAEACATQTIQTGCISSSFPDTTQGSFGKTLMISRREAPRQKSGRILFYLLFKGDVQKTFFFFCTYFSRCPSVKP